MRQIVLDTETTGLDAAAGHRIIEIGAVELIDRRPTGNTFHHYIQPDRDIDEGALAVHGIHADFLADKPRFEQIMPEFLEFVRDAQLVIHNAGFDMGFLNAELQRAGPEYLQQLATCSVLDTLALARELHPGQKNNLDALCRRYQIDNSQRELHGALLDAEILAEVYLAMTGGQVSLKLAAEQEAVGRQDERGGNTLDRALAPRIVRANDAERQAHQAMLSRLGGDHGALWQALGWDD